ncbi:conserved hypothetical protein (DUF4065 domain) [Aliarcobacter butzleri 7h1h]|uniref:Panacea domain-containing protein n=1 Tax=Aliarcobacter butzleri TaxID=28197 RepID=UPI000308749E|nr:Panacea domain-containing protein [Aliarcobacter butzleri]AGR76483.1 conserved hypothetical protein (DUF4065 domain) [Aliarcobacter butzleri 7h1h]
MNKIENIMAYLCKYYPYKKELSKARLTKLVYLSDWFSAVINQKQITNIKWIFNHFGPYVDDVTNTAINSNYFRILNTTTKYGDEKSIICFDGIEDDIDISEKDKQILDFVISKTKNMYFDEFITYVYSTYPVTSKKRYSELNLEELAKEYNQLK